MREVLEQLLAGTSLSEADARSLLHTLTGDEVDPALAASLLVALKAKGESPEELRGFAMGLRERAIDPEIPGSEGAVDVVGTGGDRSGSFNLSTGAALLTAACGATVIKHGNRSVSSRSGSADVLDALGLPIPLDEANAAALVADTGFTFLFAPFYHPAMKAIAPVRAAIGVGTIFNLVGPLANPARPGFALIGANSVAAARNLASALSGMAVTRAFVVHGDPGWDEPTPVGPYRIIEVTPGETREWVEDPADYGVERCSAGDLAGGDGVHNAYAIRRVFEGERGPHRDALALGASLALRLYDPELEPSQALGAAYAAIDDGRAATLVEKVSDFAGVSGG